MILEAVRIVAEALDDGTFGVNAKLPDVPRDQGDPEPTPIRRVLDITNDDEVAHGRLPDDWPVLIVSPEGPTEMDGEVQHAHRDGEGAGVGIRYATGSEDLAAAQRDSLYTQRAIRRTLADLMESSRLSTRTRNDVVVRAITRLLEEPMRDETSQGVITAGTLVEFQIRDQKP